MSFREKSAWIILITLILMTMMFVFHIPPPYTLAPEPSPYMFTVLIRALVIFVVVVAVAHIVVAVLAPKEAMAGKDERERLIALKATAISAYTYAFLSLGGIFVALHLVGTNAIGISYLILFAFIFSEIVNYALRIYFYRRGS